MGRSGVEGASLSAIADEAGLAIGSVRHYFPSHDAILLFAMQELADRVTGRLRARIEGLSADGVDLEVATDFLSELLPLDDQRRLEAEVWLAFITASRTRPALTDVAERVSTGIRSVVGRALTGAARRGVLGFGDPAVETERLAALLDGLTLAIIRPPGIRVATAREVLRRHLESLASA